MPRLWYSDIDPELGRDLVRRYKDTIQHAREFPRTGQLTDLPGEFAGMEVRRFPTQRFRYQVVPDARGPSCSADEEVA